MKLGVLKMLSDHEKVELAVLKEQMKTMSERFDSFEGKLDEVLELKNKGLGAFWLASAVIGSGILTGIFSFISWVKGF